jgi:hypothetical protein
MPKDWRDHGCQLLTEPNWHRLRRSLGTASAGICRPMPRSTPRVELFLANHLTEEPFLPFLTNTSTGVQGQCFLCAQWQCRVRGRLGNQMVFGRCAYATRRQTTNRCAIKSQVTFQAAASTQSNNPHERGQHTGSNHNQNTLSH